MENPGSGDKDTFNIQLQAAMTHIKLAKAAEQKDKYELAMKHYHDAASKLMELVRSEADPEKKKVFMKHINESISSAGFLKTVVKDKKNQMVAT